MKTNAFTNILLAALVGVFALETSVANAAGGPVSGRAAICRSVLGTDEKARIKELDDLIGTGLILGAFQFEAIAKVGAELGFAVVNKNTAFDTVGKRKWKDLANFLGATNSEDAMPRRDFAVKMVAYLEKNVFSKELAAHPLERKVKLEEARKGFHGIGLSSASAKQMLPAWIQFNRTLEQPQGREFLIQAMLNSNAAAAQFIGKNEAWGLDWMTRILGPGALIGPAIIFGGLGWDIGHNWGWGIVDGGLTAVAGALPFGFMLMERPEGLIRRRIMVALQRRRLRAAMAAASLTVGELSAVQAGDAQAIANLQEKIDSSTPVQPAEPVLKKAFDFEMLSAEAKSLAELKPDLGARNFKAIANFSVPVISRIDTALDLNALLSQRMAILEGEIKDVESSLDNGKLKISLEATNSLVEKALATSADIVIDGRSLNDYTATLMTKIDEHVSLGRATVNEFGPVDSAELEDVITELVGSRDLLLPSTKIIPLTIDVAQGQRAILRELRTNLRGKKIEDADSVARLVDAVGKLKNLRSALAPKS